MQHALKWFAVFTTLIMVVVLIGGALVTKTESGAGCGDSWPLCHGELIPSNITFELIVELSHRLVSGLAGFTVLILSIWSWKKIGHIRETKFLALLSVFFLVLQALIGAAAVMWGQSDAILALHFGISLISFASVLLLTLLIFEIDKKFDAKSLVINKDMKFHMVGIIVYSYVVVYTGAYVRHKGASLACPEWPLCSNRAGGLPTTLHEWIQMGHRFAAGIIFIWIAYATWRAIKHYKHEKVIYWGWIIAFILVSMQVTSGALVVITGLNLYIALAHALIISCLFGLLSYFLLLVSRSNTNIEVDSSSDQSVTK
ncbi:heme A synthase [Metabacillus litoralis]|uniref:Heme A synthase n=1 Tax=Metabacillus litoralis TaxID=152268 RepID=A0A5C6W411_9BACI|nr:heme A synthase [Metabacillus litoralis]TXC92090.1 heme A synthase [Metabacillus litoralis]